MKKLELKPENLATYRVEKEGRRSLVACFMAGDARNGCVRWGSVYDISKKKKGKKSMTKATQVAGDDQSQLGLTQVGRVEHSVSTNVCNARLTGAQRGVWGHDGGGPVHTRPSRTRPPMAVVSSLSRVPI